jgi:hypothetical protein
VKALASLTASLMALIPVLIFKFSVQSSVDDILTKNFRRCSKCPPLKVGRASRLPAEDEAIGKNRSR